MDSQSEEPESFIYSSLPSFARDAINEEDSSFLETQAPSELFDESGFGSGDGIIGRAMGGTIDSLTKIWMDERNAPEILPYEHSLVEPLILAIETQVFYLNIKKIHPKNIDTLSRQKILWKQWNHKQRINLKVCFIKQKLNE